MDKYIFNFPKELQFKLGDEIDKAVRLFSKNNIDLLNGFKYAVIAVIQFVYGIISHIPWFLLILLVAFLGYLVSRKIKIGLFYGAMLFFIGACGLWDNMLTTLSIVISSVILCLLLGFPIGVLISMNKRAEAIIHPILDLMQTMPAFVYLVPAVILFSPGKTPALLATTVYAIVPIIRMTSHGILYVDKEVVEAAQAFGSTTLQTLVKVQIPQAAPTILTGVNQTIMMAMSMVVTCAIIGAEGLGMEILIATNRTEVGKALLPGISIVVVAIILDRLTQGLIKQSKAVI